MSPSSIRQEDEMNRIALVIRENRKASFDKDFTEPIMSELYQQQGENKPGLNVSTPHAKGRKKWLLGSVSAAAVVLLLGNIVLTPSMASSLQEVPVLRSIFKLAGDLGLYRAADQDLSSHPNSSATKEDITLTIPEVIYDGTRLSLSLMRTAIGSSSSMSLQEQLMNIDILVNGQNIQSNEIGNSIPIFTLPGADENSVIIEFADLRNQGGEPLPDQFELTLNLTMDHIHEPLSMSMPVAISKEDFVMVKPNFSKTYEDLTLSIESIELTPVTTNITTRISLPEGVQYSYLTHGLSFDIFDNNGNKLKSLTGNGYNEAGGNTSISDTRYHPFTVLPESILIKPFKYIYSETEKGAFVYDENGEIQVKYISELEIEIPIKGSP